MNPAVGHWMHIQRPWGCGLWVVGCGLRVEGCGLWVEG